MKPMKSTDTGGLFMKRARLAAMAMAAVMGTAALPSASAAAPAAKAAGNYNYAEALQKSMFFYQAQQSGKLPE